MRFPWVKKYKPIESIKNEDLQSEDLPDKGNAEAVYHFAMTFNGYEHFCSFSNCAEKANNSNRQTMSKLRSELFFSARASHHAGNNLYMKTYRELEPLLKEKIECRQCK